MVKAEGPVSGLEASKRLRQKPKTNLFSTFKGIIEV
jgi:hypothetical protein